MVKYRIRQTSTGLYYQGYEYNYGFRKDGKPRTSGLMERHLKFAKDSKNDNRRIYLTIKDLNYVIDWANRNKCHKELDGCEVVAYKMTETITTVKLNNIRERAEGKLIMEKLKGK